jgi:hypothetical protein
MNEIWKDVIGYEGLYQVSNFGNVKSKNKLLKPGLGKIGYLTVVLSKNGITKCYAVHKLVAILFHNHTPCGYNIVINHIDFNKQNNNANNIELTTNRQNTNHKHLISGSKFTGVYWYKQYNKWCSKIWINGKSKHLGYFTDEYAAHLAYECELGKLMEKAPVQLPGLPT